MKHILEYFPLVAFFISYYIFDVYVATAVLIGATALQLILLKIIFNTIERKNWVVFAVVTIFGALTLYFHDDNFIKLKASIIYSIFALVLIGYQVIGQSIPKKFMGKEYIGIHRITFIIDEEGILRHIMEKVKTKTHHDDVLEIINTL